MERANRTLQDRLAKELRLAGVNGMEAGNAFLRAFMERFNQRFSIRAARPEDLHRPVNVAASRLSDILCHREQRYVGAQLTFHYDRRLIILEQTELSKGLVSRYVELYDFFDRPLEVRWKRCPASLPGLQQGPARESHSRRREQTAKPCADHRQGTTGYEARNEGQDQ